jgi:hypothetical protein
MSWTQREDESDPATLRALLNDERARAWRAMERAARAEATLARVRGIAEQAPEVFDEILQALEGGEDA